MRVVKQHGVDEEHAVARTILWQRGEWINHAQRRDVCPSVVEILRSVRPAHPNLPPTAALQVGADFRLIADPGETNPPVGVELRTVHILRGLRTVVPDQTVGRPQRRRQRFWQSRHRRPLLANPRQRLLQGPARVCVRPGGAGGPHDPDHVSTGVEHRPSAGAAANRAARLNVVVPDLDHDPAAQERQRLTPRISHRKHRLANIISGRRSQAHGRNIRHQLRIHHLQQRQIELRIRPQHDRANRSLAVDQRYKRRFPVDHVIRRDEPTAAHMKRRPKRARRLDLPRSRQHPLRVKLARRRRTNPRCVTGRVDDALGRDRRRPLDLAARDPAIRPRPIRPDEASLRTQHLTVLDTQAQLQPPELVNPSQNLPAELITRLRGARLLGAAGFQDQQRETGKQSRGNSGCYREQPGFGDDHPRHCM